MSCVYLLHIDPPYKRAKHYTGWTKDDYPGRRVNLHLAGKGSKFTSRVVAAGHKLTLVHFWSGANLKFERFVKDHVETKTQCRICGGAPMLVTNPDHLQPGFKCEGTI